jgi:oligoendopeptidase F
MVRPEIVEIGTSKVDAFERERKDLKDRFSFYLGDTLRSAPHTLGIEAEGVLAATGKVLAQPSAIHDQLADADLPYPEFTLPTGEAVRLDKPAYENYRRVSDRNERKAVFDAFRGTWHKFEGTVGAALPTLHRYLKMRKACRPAHAFSTCCERVDRTTPMSFIRKPASIWQPPGPIRRWLRAWTT